ncbi:Carbohydrate sulfotransferase 14 [Porphyridium purpureum]|uniref:Carbohydrate sulfotransferase 14 n=1 Tax=Porphyridium purpureum TaxID=35688 RepID=A0A5J4YK96_PORPP|nr:Carbohydrate sulfotransferase 14 [Porphyridium purpureum]|eukprot:POR6218..scf244_11
MNARARSCLRARVRDSGSVNLGANRRESEPGDCLPGSAAMDSRAFVEAPAHFQAAVMPPSAAQSSARGRRSWLLFEIVLLVAVALLFCPGEARSGKWNSQMVSQLQHKQEQSVSLMPLRRRSGADILQEDYASRIIVSELNRFVFCPVPKVANSNWKYVIRQLEGFSDYANLTLGHRVDLNGLRYLSDYSPDDAERILFGSEFFKFAFVRDPYTRLVSAYLDKFQNKDASSEEYRLFMAQIYSWKYVRDRDIAKEPRPSFRAFVDELLKQKPTRMNLHWMPQSYICGFGDVPYDFIGRFENLVSDASSALRFMGKGDVHFPSQEEIGFLPSGATNTTAEYYTLELMLKVKIMYEVDFVLLGYE